MSIGERVRVARTRKGPSATQKWLGDQLGTTPQAISEWEQGGRPDINKLAALRYYLSVTYEWLVTGIGECPKENSRKVLREDMAYLDLMAGMGKPKPAPRPKPKRAPRPANAKRRSSTA